MCHALFKAETPGAEPTLKSAKRVEVEAMHEHLERVLEEVRLR